jgi:hypothetical protein
MGHDYIDSEENNYGTFDSLGYEEIFSKKSLVEEESKGVFKGTK